MKIIEVRDGFIKFEADQSIYLSSFIQVSGTEKGYIAQVNQIRKIGQVCIASAKILFLMVDGTLHNYDRTEPPKDASIETFSFDIFQESLDVKKPIIAGKTLDASTNIVIDASVFNKNMLISFDDAEQCNVLITNMSKQFENLGVSSIIVDTLGILKTQKYTAGKDFKLPLNTKTLTFMYQSCLNDATEQSRSMIAEIFRDLSEYSETVPFLPFGALKSIVDDFVDNQHIFKLLVLKSKLTKFERLGYFATKQSEVTDVSKILESKFAVIDLSRLDSNFLNCYLEYIYSNLPQENTQVFVTVSNAVSKKNLKNIISESPIPSALVTYSRYQYLSDIKKMFNNFIIEPTLSNKEQFKVYSSFFDSMDKNSYLIAGEGINYIPMVSPVTIIDEIVSYEPEKEVVQNESAPDEIEQNETEIIQGEVHEAEQEDVHEDVPITPSEPLSGAASEVITDEQKNVPSQDEIIANIEEKSENLINSISENLEEPQDMELFSDEDVIEDEAEDDSDDEDIPQEEISDIIEPEYTEVNTETDEPEEYIDLEESVDSEVQDDYDIQEDTLEISEEQEPEIIEDVLEEELPEQEMTDEYDVSEEQAPVAGSGDVTEEENSEEILLQEVISDDENESYEIADLPQTQDGVEISSEDIVQEDELEEQLEDISEYDEVSGNEEFAEMLEDSDVIQDSDEEIEELDIQLDDNDEALLQEVTELPEESDYEDTVSDVQTETISVAPIEEDNSLDGLEELDISEAQDDDIIVDMTDDGDNINIDEDIDKQIVEDVDKVYTTMKESEELEEISDSDLDLIDELNNDEGNSIEELTDSSEEMSDFGMEDGILDQPQEGVIPQKEGSEREPEILEKRDSNTPIVPVYDADIPQEDMVESDTIQQGDSVIHAKYGNGVVEKMIKYGTKTLFSINFENIGRRLLDPTLTEIKKL